MSVDCSCIRVMCMAVSGADWADVATEARLVANTADAILVPVLGALLKAKYWFLVLLYLSALFNPRVLMNVNAYTGDPCGSIGWGRGGRGFFFYLYIFFFLTMTARSLIVVVIVHGRNYSSLFSFYHHQVHDIIILLLPHNGIFYHIPSHACLHFVLYMACCNGVPFHSKSASPSISRSVCAVKLLADSAFSHLCLGNADDALRAVRRFCSILKEFPGIMR